MKKTSANPASNGEDEMLPEYDFSQGVRGKHHRAFRDGYTVTIHHANGTTTVQHFEPDRTTIPLDPDVQKYFPDAESVNRTLRALITLIPRTEKHAQE